MMSDETRVDPRQILIKEFDYPLPPERIAQFPLPERDTSKLLVYRNGKLSEDVFSRINEYLDKESLLVFNETKVVRARLIFKKPTGGCIEIFCLEPLEPPEIHAAFLSRSQITWKCLIGNAKKWKTGLLEKKIDDGNRGFLLKARQAEEFKDGTYAVAFSWQPAIYTFSEILELAGQVPLPPYIHRNPGQEDSVRYQTIYARQEGSVAAPTAGLHFTDKVFQTLRQKGCSLEKVTLHVGHGTFKPVTAEKLGEHQMHHEKIEVSREALIHISAALDKPIIAIGTTAARTLESLYWMGCKCLNGRDEGFSETGQWDPYLLTNEKKISPREALNALINWLNEKRVSHLRGDTRLIIAPGYEYRLVSGLITNFHMPQSTLLLLVSALIGKDWKKAYDYALQNDFRFLSYGDSCLFYKI